MRMKNRAVLALLVASFACAGALSARAGQDLTRAPRITMPEFKKLLAEDKIYVIDVRSYSTYLLGHIPGAHSVPLDEVGLKVDELKAITKPIVAYCA
jgi:3-mercaptopyruvate sulfurtransferase SseA